MNVWTKLDKLICLQLFDVNADSVVRFFMRQTYQTSRPKSKPELYNMISRVDTYIYAVFF